MLWQNIELKQSAQLCPGQNRDKKEQNRKFQRKQYADYQAQVIARFAETSPFIPTNNPVNR